MDSQNPKTVLILGAASDMAVAIARDFSKKKCRIILAGRSLGQLKEIASDLKIRYEADAEVVKFDALDFSTHEKFYQDLKNKPDIVVCVFGYLGDQSVAETNWKETETILHTNFTGAVSILNIVANDMDIRKDGVIVGISSVAGDRGKLSNYIYGSAKAAFTAYLSGLRNRLFHSGVHVLTVKPGFVATQMTANMNLPPLLTGTPDRVARQIAAAIIAKRNVIYTLRRWRLLMLIINNIPEFIFKRLKM